MEPVQLIEIPEERAKQSIEDNPVESPVELVNVQLGGDSIRVSLGGGRTGQLSLPGIIRSLKMGNLRARIVRNVIRCESKESLDRLFEKYCGALHKYNLHLFFIFFY